jgi:hypothetical protein
MCAICRGATTEEVFLGLHLQIVDRGFAIVTIGTRAENKGWAYTIGLIDSTKHPELVVAGYPLGHAVDVLDELGAAVMAGVRLDSPGDHLVLRCTEIGTRLVHERHLQEGLMAFWYSYYEGVGRQGLVPQALQIVLPDDDCCFEHQTAQPRLDQSHHVPFDGITRQQRRARPTAKRQR